jgi:hypothetical protein
MVKKSIITVFVIISLYFVSSVAIGLLGIPSPIWSDTDCGGIDPYHNGDCVSVGAGYKQQCRWFVCTKEPVPVGLPSFDRGEVDEPVDAVDDDEDDDKEREPSS